MLYDSSSPFEAPDARAHAPRKHLAHVPWRIVPQSRSTANGATNQVARALFPWDVYPGIERGMHEIVGKRVKIDTLRKWRNGRKRSPAWAKQMMADALEKRIAEMQAALDAIKKAGG